MDTILFVDDDLTFTKIIVLFLRRHGYSIDTCHSVKDAEIALKKQPYSLFLLDYRLPDGTAFDIMAAAKRDALQTPVVIMTSFNDIRTAVTAIRSGAFDYITKPVNQEELLMLIENTLQRKVDPDGKQPDLLLSSVVEGTSESAKKLSHQIRLIAPTDMSVIINGESGTGKEYIARQIHSLSTRAEKNFIALDCGTLSAELAASELFGHAKGAFTGALHNKTGKFEEANGGTLFLDEIGNLGYEVQIKLLRALQERTFYPVGSNNAIKFDVRIVVATNEDLRMKANEGKFRGDLYHRLNEFKINVPPLRQRTEDLKLFVAHFIEESNKSLKKQVATLSAEVMDVFRMYDWPGNIRELKNIVKRIVLLADADVADKDDLPEDMLLDIKNPFGNESSDLKFLQEQKEKEMIEKILEEVKFNKLKAARLLNINRSTLYAKMEKYNIKP